MFGAAFQPPAIVFPKDEELSTPQIKEVPYFPQRLMIHQLLQYRLENSSSLDDIFALAATLLTKQEWGFVQDVCKFAQGRIGSLDQARRKRLQRLSEIASLKSQLIPVHDKNCLTFEEVCVSCVGLTTPSGTIQWPSSLLDVDRATTSRLQIPICRAYDKSCFDTQDSYVGNNLSTKDCTSH